MAFVENVELPADVLQLPPAAQHIYRSAFKAAISNSSHDPVETADAHNLGWQAVQRVYVKEGGEWVLRGVPN